MRKPERKWETTNQHAIEGMWKTYLEQRKKLGRKLKTEELTRHRTAFFCGAASGAHMIIRSAQISSDPLVQRQWATDILYEIREGLKELTDEFEPKRD